MSRSEEINHRLNAAFSPQFLEVIDESEHIVAMRVSRGGESHFRQVCGLPVLPASRIARHRAVHAAWAVS